MKIEKAILIDMINQATEATSKSALAGSGRLFSVECKAGLLTIRANSSRLAARVQCEIGVSEDFSALVDSVEFTRTAKMFDKEIELTLDAGNFKFKEGGFVKKIAVCNSETAFYFPDCVADSWIKFDGGTLRNLFIGTDKIISNADDGTPRCVVRFTCDEEGVINVIASDGRVVSHRRSNLENGKALEVNLYPETIRLLTTGEDCEIAFTTSSATKRIHIKRDHCEYMVILPANVYPDFLKVLAPNETDKEAFKISIADLKEAVEKFLEFDVVSLSWDNCKLILEADRKASSARFELEVSETYAADIIKLNPKFIMSALSNASDKDEMKIVLKAIQFKDRIGRSFVGNFTGTRIFISEIQL